MAWTVPETTDQDRDRIVGAGSGERVHAIEYRWLDALRTTRLYAYRLPADPFRPIGEPLPHALVATVPVTPLGPPVPVGDLLAAHEGAGIQLRVLHNLWPFWDAVQQSTLGWSGIRLRNALPRKGIPA
jgi:hypothetical protein